MSKTVLALALVAALAAPPAAPASAGSAPGAAHSLSACVQRTGALIVAFEVDRSGSLAHTDPQDRRVDGISSALIGLERLTARGPARPHVEVLLGSFAGTALPRSGDAASHWRRLNGRTLDRLLEEAAAYAHQDHGRDTDYVLAFEAAEDALQQRAAAIARDGGATPCKALIFISDGRYQLTMRSPGSGLPATVHYAPGVRLDTPDGPDAAVALGRNALCDPDGLMDRLASANVITFTVALSSSADLRRADRDFLRAIATGSGGRGCGVHVSPATGQHIDVRRNLDLFLIFSNLLSPTPISTGTVCPGSPCREGTRTFAVGPDIAGFAISVSAPLPGISLALTSPDGTTRVLAPDGPRHVRLPGDVDVVQRWVRARSVDVRVDLRGDAAAWTGTWGVSFLGPAGVRLPSPPYTLQLVPGLRARIVDDELQRGATTTLEVEIVGADGAPAGHSEFAQSADLKAWLILEGQTRPLPVARQADDRFAVEVHIPDDTSAKKAIVDVKLDFDAPGASVESRGGRFPLSIVTRTVSKMWQWIAGAIAALIASLGIVIRVTGWAVPLPRKPRRGARGTFTPPQRLRVLSRPARVIPGRSVSLEPDPGRPRFGDFLPLEREGDSRGVRHIEHEPFTLQVRGGLPFVRQRGEASAGGQQLIGGTLAEALPDRRGRRVCEVPLTLENTWLFAVEHRPADGEVQGQLLLITGVEDDTGAELLDAARNALATQSWDDFDQVEAEDGPAGHDDDEPMLLGRLS
jgi:hypothetical protein